MKKLTAIFSVITLMCALLVSPVYAMETNNGTPNMTSFQIDDVMSYGQVYGVRSTSALVAVPVSLNLNNGLSTDLIVTVEPQVQATRAAGGTNNISVKGNFYRTSDKQTVTLYGVSGTVEYTGSNTKITGKSGYHNSALSGWTGTYSLSTEYHPELSHVSVIAADYTCYYNNSESSTAWVRIAVSESGYVSVGGDYVSYTTN